MTTSDSTVTSTPTAQQIVESVDLTGKTVVITGATSGLGRESARCVALTGARVVLTGRDTAALADTDAWIREQVPQALTATVHLDLASLASVSAAAAQISDLTPAVHVLMNNAGVMFTPFERTVDAFEMQFGTNHLGHFELTRSLLPALVAADGARVVNLSSEGHRLGDVDLDDSTGSAATTTSSPHTARRKLPTCCTRSNWIGGCATAACGRTRCIPASSRRRWPGTWTSRISPR